jgi:D-aminoacyl-tRNA deacylase
MRVIVQKVKKAKVEVDQKEVGSILEGLMVLVGVTHDDEVRDAEYLAEKLVHLRIFEDEQGKMNLSLKDVGGSILSVSQFTLYGDTRKGRRPNFMNAAKPDVANDLYEKFNQIIRSYGVQVETGEFGAMMDVTLTNHGPVTLLIDSQDKK